MNRAAETFCRVLFALAIACNGLPTAAQSAPTTTTTALKVTTAILSAGPVIATLVATVKDASGNAITAGEVDFSDGLKPSGTSQIVWTTVGGFTVGTATLKLPLGQGTHSVSARYIGDLKHAPSASAAQTLTVAGSRGDSNLYPAATYALTDVPTSVVLADFNGDGLPDVIATTQTNGKGLVVFLNDPSRPGTFLAPFSIPNSAQSGYAVLADIDGDGLLDIAATLPNFFSGNSDFSAGASYVLLQDPAHPGTFKPSFTVLGGRATAFRLSVLDMNGDGVPDIVMAGGFYQPGASGDGAGIGFQSATNRGSIASAADSWLYVNSQGSFEPLFGDVDRDGLPDVVFPAPSFYNNLVVFNSSTSKPGSLSNITLSPSIDGAYSAALIDFDNDGLPDVLLTGGNKLSVQRNNPASPGSFLPPVTTALTAAAVDLAVGDIDGDGNPDVVLAEYNNALDVYGGDGKGNLSASKLYAVSTPPGEALHIAVGDIDGDGLDDVVTTTGFYNNVTVPTFQLNVLTHVKPAGYHPLPTVLLTSPQSSPYLGTPVTFNVALRSAFGTPSGTVTFSIGSTTLGAAVVDVAGNCSFTTSTLPAGNDTVTAHYSGDTTFASTDAALGMVVVGSASTVTLTASSPAIYVGENATFTVKVSGSAGVPSGAVAFFAYVYGFDNALQTLQLDSAGSAVLNTNAVPQGASEILVIYRGDTVYQSASAFINISAKVATIALTGPSSTPTVGTPVSFTASVAQVPALAGRTVGFFDYAVLQYTTTTAADGTATWTSPGLSAGSHYFTARYLPPNPVGNVTSNGVSYFISAASVSLTLAGAPAQPTAGQSTVLSAIVSSPGTSRVPTGTVTFKLDGVNFSQATLDPTGKASVTSPAIPAGSHMLSATYSGDSIFGQITQSLYLSIAQPDFTFTVDHTGLSVGLGQSGTVNLTIGAATGLSESIALSCSGLPVGANCAFAPSTLTPNGSAATSVLTVTAPSTLAHNAPAPHPFCVPEIFAAVICPFTLFTLARSRRRIAPALLLFVSAVLCTALGCSGGGSSSGGTSTPSTRTVTYSVVARGTTSGNSHTIPMTLTY